MDEPLWPNGARCAVVVTVDFNDAHGIIATEPRAAGREKTLSVWRYGARRGVDRVLAALDERRVRTSWFVPGAVAEEHRALVAAVHGAGHEIGCNGYRCEDFSALDLAGQLAAVDKGCAALGDAAGVKPTGFRVALGSWAPGFPAALAARGFRWSSSWRGDDLPYFHPGVAAERGLVELPLHYELEDEPYFVYNLYPPVPSGQPRIASYREALGNWRQDFAAFHRYGLCFVLTIHPEIIGTAGRIDLLRELLAHIAGHDGVWFATGEEVAAWWSQARRGNEPRHPAEIFAAHLAGGAR